MKNLLKSVRKRTGREPLDLLAILISLIFIAAGSLVSIHRFWQFEVFYYDFGIFDRAIWLASRFSAPIIEHIDVPGKWIFADHFHPSIFLISPFYWLTSRSEMLLFVQAAAAGLAGLVIYHIGLHVLKNRYYSICIMLSYYLFIGLQNAIITDFHESTVATLPLALSFYFIIKKKLWPYIVSFLITLGFKESMPLLGLGLAAAIIFLQPTWRKIAIATGIVSVVYGFLVLKVFIPFFSEGFYGYGETIVLNPIAIFSSFFNNPEKIHTMTYTFLSFGFLPLFTPTFWLLILQDLYIRFLTAAGLARFGMGFHYSALLSVIMGVSSVYGLKNIQRFLPPKVVLALISLSLLTNIYLYRVTFHGPLALAYNADFYRHSKDFGFLETLVNKIPKESTVMSQNNLLVRFTHHKDMWLLRSNYQDYMPDYIVLDMRPGQNANNHFGPMSETETFFTNLKNDPRYTIIYKTDYQYIFQHKK